MEKKPQGPETKSLGFAIGALLMIFGVVLFFMGPDVRSLFIFVIGVVAMAFNHVIKYGNH
ncbi:MAG: hypothetical protein LKJ18_01880 [Ancrocorticia sp.]|jgi:hypothetical protein|nr:hypothetical protein [Ancrocorticia sp.]MCI1962888.1 hypothetical protein [Ancrocorticia sp.]MCI2001832.1 hypothetical protein [Ancrocorticia sp.]MCI2001885.1 hypothetical protein [Ancrocorticia sp.]